MKELLKSHKPVLQYMEEHGFNLDYQGGFVPETEQIGTFARFMDGYVQKLSAGNYKISLYKGRYLICFGPEFFLRTMLKVAKQFKCALFG